MELDRGTHLIQCERVRLGGCLEKVSSILNVKEGNGDSQAKKDKKGYGHRGEKQLEQSENGGPLGLLEQGEGWGGEVSLAAGPVWTQVLMLRSSLVPSILHPGLGTCCVRAEMQICEEQVSTSVTLVHFFGKNFLPPLESLKLSIFFLCFFCPKNYLLLKGQQMTTPLESVKKRSF